MSPSFRIPISAPLPWDHFLQPLLRGRQGDRNFNGINWPPPSLSQQGRERGLPVQKEVDSVQALGMLELKRQSWSQLIHAFYG